MTNQMCRHNILPSLVTELKSIATDQKNSLRNNWWNSYFKNYLSLSLWNEYQICLRPACSKTRSLAISCLAVPLFHLVIWKFTLKEKKLAKEVKNKSDWGLTSLERVLSDRLAEDTEACSCVRRHLDLILRPDDELGDEAVVDIRAGDVLLLVLTREPC